MLAAGVRAIGAQAPKLDPGMDTVLRRMLASTPHPKKAPTPSGGKMFAHRRVRFEYVALFLVLASVARASPSDVSKPLATCVGEAAAAEKFLLPMTQDGRPLESSTVTLMCEGSAASALFQAMELVATQDMSNPPTVWRRSKGVQCAWLPGPPPSYMCTVAIEVEAPLAKAMQ